MSALDLSTTAIGIGHVTIYVFPISIVTRLVSPTRATNRGSGNADGASPVKVTSALAFDTTMSTQQYASSFAPSGSV